ncbi:hypothetical protein EII29_01055 [Leptotrichia sp. OH3620_COT-345]|nr:hypothetical protein EII29_01055 [Leptotrichia sp. OH3620_COT-345]
MFTLIKFGLAGLSFNFYLSRRFNKINYVTILFSFCYWMMAYNMNNALNIMWLDRVILLPVILNYLMSFIKKKKNRNDNISSCFNYFQFLHRIYCYFI